MDSSFRSSTSSLFRDEDWDSDNDSHVTVPGEVKKEVEYHPCRVFEVKEGGDPPGGARYRLRGTGECRKKAVLTLNEKVTADHLCGPPKKAPCKSNLEKLMAQGLSMAKSQPEIKFVPNFSKPSFVAIAIRADDDPPTPPAQPVPERKVDQFARVSRNPPLSQYQQPYVVGPCLEKQLPSQNQRFPGNTQPEQAPPSQNKPPPGNARPEQVPSQIQPLPGNAQPEQVPPSQNKPPPGNARPEQAPSQNQPFPGNAQPEQAPPSQNKPPPGNARPEQPLPGNAQPEQAPSQNQPQISAHAQAPESKLYFTGMSLEPTISAEARDLGTRLKRCRNTRSMIAILREINDYVKKH